MVASGGEHGMELFRTAMLKNQPYEVVITDLGMPKMDGHQVAQTIKAEFPHTPVIMMTGLVDTHEGRWRNRSGGGCRDWQAAAYEGTERPASPGYCVGQTPPLETPDN
jgi:CheY-like chemotaxis protein